MSTYKAGETIYFTFRVFDIFLNTPKTGLLDADVNKNIFHEGATPGTPPTINFNEIGDGYYSIDFIPNSLGWWHVDIHHISWDISIFSENFKCLASNIDDVAVLVPSGTVPVEVTVEDTVPNPIDTVSIAVWDDGHTTLIGHVMTGVDGKVSFTVNPGDYELWPYKNMYDFPGTPYTFTAVLGTPESVNIVATPQFIRRPSRVGHCIVWGFLVDTMGKAVHGAAVESLREDSGIITTPHGHGLGNPISRTHTNIQGYFELELLRGILVTVRIPGQNHQRKFIVPDQSNIDFFTITESYPP